MSSGAIHGKSARVLKQTGTANVFTQQAMTNTGNNKRYKITNATHAYFDPTAAVTVEKSTNAGSSWSPVVSGFEIEHAGGHIVFTVANGPTDLIRVSGKSFTLADWGAMTNWKVTINVDLLDATNFASAGWKEFVPNLKDFEGSCDGFWLDGTNITLFSEQGTAPSYHLFSLYLDYGASKRRYDGYGVITSENIDLAKATEVIKEGISYKIARMYYREG